MANMLDEMSGPTLEQGRDAHVVAKQLPVTVGWGTKVCEILFFFPGFLLLFIPPIIYFTKKIHAQNHLRKLEQKINTNASTIDNYMEQRVMILKNAAQLVDKAIDLDKDTMTTIAAYRGGKDPKMDEVRNEVSSKIDAVSTQINMAFERYPDLKAHDEIRDAMQQNAYLQREITAARDLYNDSINQWNKDVSEWMFLRMVAAKEGYTTRIPFVTTAEIKAQARDTFF